MEKMEGRLEIRKNFWSVRVANKWNQLPDMGKLAKTVNRFKNGLDNWTGKEKKRRAAAYLGGTLVKHASIVYRRELLQMYLM